MVAMRTEMDFGQFSGNFHFRIWKPSKYFYAEYLYIPILFSTFFLEIQEIATKSWSMCLFSKFFQMMSETKRQTKAYRTVYYSNKGQVIQLL